MLFFFHISEKGKQYNSPLLKSQLPILNLTSANATAKLALACVGITMQNPYRGQGRRKEIVSMKMLE